MHPPCVLVQRNLRVVICLDTGRPDVLQARLAANPALLNKCVMLWWPGWGDAGLAAMAEARLKVSAALVHLGSCWAAGSQGWRGVSLAATTSSCLNSRTDRCSELQPVISGIGRRAIGCRQHRYLQPAQTTGCA